MPDPFSITAGALSIALNAHRLCADTALLVSGIRDAPAHLTRLTSDLKSVDVVICTLSEGLRAEAQGTARQRLIVSVQELLGSCVEVFEDIRKLVKPYVGEDGRMKGGWWKKYRWEAWQKGEVAVFQKALSEYKQTLGLACATLNYFNSNITNDAVHTIQGDVHRLLQQVQNGQGGSKKYHGPMERFLEDTETVIMTEPMDTPTFPKDVYDDDDGATTVTLRPEDAIDERLERLQLNSRPSPPLPPPPSVPMSVPVPSTASTLVPKNPPSFSITAICRELDHIHVFCIDAYGYVQEAHWQPAFSDWFHGWFQRGDVKFPANGHVTAVSHAPGHLHLIATDIHGRIMGCRASPADNQEGETWGPWEQITDSFAPPGAYVAAVAWKNRGKSQIELFVCKDDGQVWTNAYGHNSVTQQDQWLGPWICMRSDNFKGVPGCSISAVSRLDGHLDVFLADVEGRIMTTARGVDTNGWLHWWYFGINATPGGGVTAVVSHTNRLDIFAVDAAGVACNAWWDGARPKPGWNWWNGPNELLPSTKFIAGSWISVVSRSDGQMDLFGVDKEGKMMAAANTGGSWVGWWHINNEYGHPGAPVAACVRRKDHLDIASVRRSDQKVIAAAWNPGNVNWFAGWWQLRDLVVHHSEGR